MPLKGRRQPSSRILGFHTTVSEVHCGGRVCRGVELDLLYVDVIVRRVEAATGNQAVLVETGETFEALATQGAGTRVGLRRRLQLSPTSPTNRRGTGGCYRSSARVRALRRSEVRIRREPPWVPGALWRPW
jgi:hypothetical protein